MTEEARRLLAEALKAEPVPSDAYGRLRRHFADLGGVELDLPLRLPGRELPVFA